ncbi:transposase-like protein [Dysgonomonas sp. PFB1-18]|uniref:phBC6A51 family helix-turn-helix protein n=1 Tax=unclassified Dysgonomonas TaxID=2630389 RepID=UPI002473DA0F|nr:MULTISPECIES: phBC6A51 family helix-turn-helix protein [unclassified Dysgonomonas]MDL2303174.1 DNA-packaging protein [Dysgonomonas sp. OttesenSCG-928-D17]MDH6308232.1 transposase-like protein [Dysgonomonas sp. PF1-14]MDH6338329.1 transposase-like protein [Dysgonomonas sp. PF1-16]MDH6379826.1 transposase-like protein [Dysgonomonas sp. PFB1-18]MDH6397084.1 transposase-like protein [Dysgonomonas sp. PF1-23]
MAKYSDELTEKIVELLVDKFYSITEVCKALGISRKTFYSWQDSKPEFSTAIEDAMRHRRDTLLSMAHSTIRRRLEGGMLTEEKYIYVPDENNPSKLILKSRVICTKEYLPDLRTIKMILDREDKRKAMEQAQSVEKADKVETEKKQPQAVSKEQAADRVVAEDINPVTESIIVVDEDVQEVTSSKVAKNNKQKKTTACKIRGKVKMLSESRLQIA